MISLLLGIPALVSATTHEPSYESYLAHVAAAEASLRLAEDESYRRWLAAAPAEHRGFEWQWLDSLRDQSSATWAGELGLTAIDVSPDGTVLAVGDEKGEVVLRDSATGREIRRIAAHASAVTDVDFDPTGGRLVTASYDRKVRVWNVSDGRSLLDFTRHGYPVGGCAFGPDGSTIASCAYERPPGTVVGTLHVWNAETGEITKTFEAGRKPLVGLAFSPDGRHVAAGSWDFGVFVCDLRDGGAPRKLAMPDEGKYNAVDAVAFSPDGRFLAAASKDDTARVWNLATGELTSSMRGHGNYVGAVAFTADGSGLLTGSRDSTLRLWNVADGSSTAVLRGPTGPVTGVAIFSDGTRAWSISDDGSLRAWSLDASLYGVTSLRATAAVYSCVWSPDGARVYSCSYDGRVQAWDAAACEPLAAWSAHPAESSCHVLACSPDGTRIYTGSYDKTLAVFDALTLVELARFPLESGAFFGRLSPDGSVFAMGLLNRKVALIDTATGATRQLIAERTQSLTDVAFSPDGRWLACAAGDGAVDVHDVASGARIRRIEVDGTQAVLFSPDGSRLWIGGSVVREVRVSDGVELRVIDAGRSTASRLARSADGQRVAIASREAVLIDTRAGATTASLHSALGSLWFVEWSPVAPILALASMDGAVGIVDPRPIAVRAAERAKARARRAEATLWLGERLAAGEELTAIVARVRAEATIAEDVRRARGAAILQHASRARAAAESSSVK